MSVDVFSFYCVVLFVSCIISGFMLIFGAEDDKIIIQVIGGAILTLCFLSAMLFVGYSIHTNLVLY
jgi:type IV secretory pathway VirB2 component (pilin)